MKTGKILLSLLVQLLIGIALGIGLLSLVYCIPTTEIEKHVKSSAIEIIEKEGLYPEITHVATSYLDNWTDSIMLASAAHPNQNSPVVEAMRVPRYVASEFPDESLVIWAKTGEYTYEDHYPQYWHGYLLFLKPLLALTDYRGVRILNGICQTALTLTIAWMLWKKNRKEIILPWLISVAMLMPLAMAKCMQFSSCYYVFSLSSLAVLCRRKQEDLFFIFLWTGIAVAFFDFLTYPISTFGIPAVFYLIDSTEEKWKTKMKNLLLLFVIWAAGYGLMWGGKILFGGMIGGLNSLQETGNHVGHWFDGERWFSIGYVFYFNVRDFIYTPVSFFAFGFALVLVYLILRKKALNEKMLTGCIPYLVLAALPFLWYLFLFNPSGIHHFFTNKACVVCAFSMLCMLAVCLRETSKPAGSE